MPSAAKIQWPQGQPLFEVQWRAVAESLAGNGIVSASDLEVTATATDLEIQVAAGDTFYIGQTYSLGAAETHTLTAGDSTNDRWDTVYFDTATSTSGVREGTPAASPEPPDVQGGELLLAVVYVPANATDVPGSDVLNWRAQFSNEAEEVQYDDPSGVYGVNNVAAALTELQKAAQITQYPLSIATDTEASAYPLANSDIANSQVTVNAGSGLSTTNAAIGLGGSATISISAGDITLTELNSPFALPSISDMDAGGNDLVDGATTIWDTAAGYVPRPQIDTQKATSTVSTATHTTANEEVIFVQTSTIAGPSTITLASVDATDGNTIVVTDSEGAASANPITVDTEGTETIAGVSSKVIESDGGALVFTSDGTNWSLGGGGAGGGFDPAEIFEGRETGSVTAGNQGVLIMDHLADGETVEVYKAVLVLADGSAVGSSTTLELVSLDNAGAFTSRATLITGDGATIFDDETGSPLGTYTNATGAGQTIGVLVDNGEASAIDIIAAAEGVTGL